MRLLALLFSVLVLIEYSHTSLECRDRYVWPFSEGSIWNTPIGSNAKYVPAKIFDRSNPLRALPQSFHNDQEWLILAKAGDPLVPWLDTSGNFPGMPPPCGQATGQEKTKIQLPDFVTDCPPNNNGAGVLLPDNRTLIQMQPLYRPVRGGPIYAWYHNGAPQPFPWSIDILSDGALGAHGGSGLSSFGGAIRVGELLPGAPPISHALKLELWAHAYYYYDYVNYASCFTWPAVGCDSYYNNPGIGYNGTLSFLKPGALLAVPPSEANIVRSKVSTVPGKKILDALVDYGGYIVDDTGSQQGGAAICMEHAVNEQVLNSYGYSIAIENPLTPTQGSTLYNDLVTIFQALSVVSNNGPTTIGGGGTPRKPLAPPICT